ncbi:hypothetical protein ACLKA7_001917 [Drosophila subpalustris]
MERYTPQERGIIVSIFLRNNSSVVLAQREFCRRFPGRPTPTAQTLRRLATNLEEYGTTRDVAKSGRPRSARSAENVCAVHAGGVIGPFFFENAAGQTTTVDGPSNSLEDLAEDEDLANLTQVPAAVEEIDQQLAMTSQELHGKLKEADATLTPCDDEGNSRSSFSCDVEPLL